jgi:hypothetical protein
MDIPPHYFHHIFLLQMIRFRIKNLSLYHHVGMTKQLFLTGINTKNV